MSDLKASGTTHLPWIFNFNDHHYGSIIVKKVEGEKIIGSKMQYLDKVKETHRITAYLVYLASLQLSLGCSEGKRSRSKSWGGFSLQVNILTDPETASWREREYVCCVFVYKSVYEQKMWGYFHSKREADSWKWKDLCSFPLHFPPLWTRYEYEYLTNINLTTIVASADGLVWPGACPSFEHCCSLI